MKSLDVIENVLNSERKKTSQFPILRTFHASFANKLVPMIYFLSFLDFFYKYLFAVKITDSL